MESIGVCGQLQHKYKDQSLVKPKKKRNNKKRRNKNVD